MNPNVETYARRRPPSPATLALSHRRLLVRVAEQLAARYAGSIIGRGWVWLGPLLILAIYGAVYVGIFGRASRPSEFSTCFLCTGLVRFS